MLYVLCLVLPRHSLSGCCWVVLFLGLVSCAHLSFSLLLFLVIVPVVFVVLCVRASCVQLVLLVGVTQGILVKILPTRYQVE
jgi:hypothetical protein